MLRAIYQWILKILGIKKEVDNVPQGLQVFDRGGNIVLDITDRLSRVLGSVNTGAVAGSTSNAALSSGTPWHMNTNADGTIMGTSDAQCVVSFSGTTMSWSYGAGTAKNVDILYGVY